MLRITLAEWLRALADRFEDGHWRLCSRSLDKVCEEMDARLQRQHELGLTGPAPEAWQSFWYMRQGYRVSPAQQDSEGHWRGGAAIHEGAECPLCQKPLSLLWDVNCGDPRFRAESPDLFAGLARLPLYYCCRCPEPTAYRMVSPKAIEVFPQDRQASEESPFSGFPEAFERSPVQLERIPRDVENLLAIVGNVDWRWLHAHERERLAEYLDDDHAHLSLCLSQFGGLPSLIQGHQDVMCPNPDCLTRKMGNMLMDCRQYRMKELAVIDDDAGFEMKTSCAKIVFHICWKCLAIHARYDID